MDFSQFIVQQGLYIAAGLYVLGVFFKNTPAIPDWVIPWILIACGIIAAGISMEGGFTFQNIIQGVFAAGAATLTNQAWKQTIKREPGTMFLNHTGYNLPQEGEELSEIDDLPQPKAFGEIEDAPSTTNPAVFTDLKSTQSKGINEDGSDQNDC